MKNPPAKPDRLATPEQVSEYLQDIPLKTLARWRSIGTGPRFIRVGRHVRYDWDDVRAWKDSQKSATAATA
ncbi:MAG: helix-turn-helix transcriptional regulator [Streptosporangiaceae bacterium]